MASLVVLADFNWTFGDHKADWRRKVTDAVDLLGRQGIPLVVSSSRTRAQIELLQQELGIRHPFICECGAAVFVPRDYFGAPPEGGHAVAGYDAIDFGRPYADVVERLHATASRLGIDVIGFSDMTVDEVSLDWNMPLLEAHLAKLREYAEPFRVVGKDPEAFKRLSRALAHVGLRCRKGTRYHHVSAVADPGTSVRVLRGLYRRADKSVVTVAVGCCADDLTLLRMADVPVVVRGADGGETSRLHNALPGARVTAETGPAGWLEAITAVVGERAALSH